MSNYKLSTNSKKGVELTRNNFLGDVYLAMGESDTAFLYYDKAIENREGNMLFKKNHIHASGLTEDPRAIQMFKNMNVVY